MSTYIKKKIRNLLCGCLFLLKNKEFNKQKQDSIFLSKNKNRFCKYFVSNKFQIFTKTQLCLLTNTKKTYPKCKFPEVYAGKTGLELPIIALESFSKKIYACFTGPDGGVTNVHHIKQLPITNLANIDEEMFISLEEESLCSCNLQKKCFINNVTNLKCTNKSSNLSITALKSDKNFELDAKSDSLSNYDWNSFNEDIAYGLSTSLYEKHPLSGKTVGNPIADVFAIIARENNCVFALADGVNWGEDARLAARCAVRGALDHINKIIVNTGFQNTRDVFHAMLGAFYAGHALILQEGGSLTTLCVALIASIKNSNNSALCVCNVGDSLCFVYNSLYGVREITLASHDIKQMRDMRDAGGALGPVNGRNPQLNNLTCSMTFVEDDDVIFITSDGVSDNFDPVVEKICTIDSANVNENLQKLNSKQKNNKINLYQQTFFQQILLTANKFVSSLNNIKIISSFKTNKNKKLKKIFRNSSWVTKNFQPTVNAEGRHKLMLLQMSNVISNNLEKKNILITTDKTVPNVLINTSLNTNNQKKIFFDKNLKNKEQNLEQQINIYSKKAAYELCKNLIHFVHYLTLTKRLALENPELYRTRTHSKTEERLRRKMIRNFIAKLPGKLDHATVVAYKVSNLNKKTDNKFKIFDNSNFGSTRLKKENSFFFVKNLNFCNNVVCNISFDKKFESEFVSKVLFTNTHQQKISNSYTVFAKNFIKKQFSNVILNKKSYETISFNSKQNIAQENVQKLNLNKNFIKNRTKKTIQQLRQLQARHTLGVDIAWLNRFVINNSYYIEKKT